MALIAYLQKLGAYDVVEPPTEPAPVKPRAIKPGIPDGFRLAPPAESTDATPPEGTTTAQN